jgi:hypothetical protein
MTREEAIEAGLKTFTGKPCIKCGGVERSVAQKSCVACNRKNSKKWLDANPMKMREINAAWELAHPGDRKDRKARSRPEDPEAVKRASRARRRLRRCHFAAKDKQWRVNNRPTVRAKAALRRAKKIQASPPWLTTEHRAEIHRIYSSCPDGYHVDHIIPLNNPLVCGLHVPWNLQHLAANENIAKSNRFDPYDLPALRHSF